MKTKNLKLAFAVSAIMSSSAAFTEAEVTGKIIHESAKYTKELGSLAKTKALGSSSGHGKDIFKSETSARIFIDGDLEDLREGATYHVELQAFNDSKAGSNQDGNELYTQRDALREAYVDTEYEDWSIRAGKQQVVWGTADGMKLLDNINPTDFSEMAQNQMEDSRIPVWMLNAEKDTEDGGNFQFIISQPKENIFAGLNRNISTSVRSNGTSLTTAASTAVDNTTGRGHDQGHAFILKGVDSITGKANGFVNIVPDLGDIARRFYEEFSSRPVSGTATLYNTQNMTVGLFADYSASAILAAENAGGFAPGPSDNNYDNIYAFANGYGWDGAEILGGFAGAYDTNLQNATDENDWGSRGIVDSTFEYMDRTTFSTFDSFVNAKSQYKYDMPSDGDVDYSMRYKNTLDDGTNYSLNYSYAYDKNPIIDIDWRNSNGDVLTTTRVNNTTYGTTSLTLKDSNGKYYGGEAGAGTKSSIGSGIPILTFTQKVKRAHNIGGSFDTTIETGNLGPVVIRGEAVYIKDTYSPVMDLTALSIGDLPAALKMEKGDRFKYVLGADITALTNMMVSVQFIQDRNLDYVDTTSVINDESDSRFTTDYATMHLTNGFNKAEKDKNFYSLYLSKPFGESGQHRWNNIFIFEENGGKWNRLDAEYTIDDNTIATVEYNKYWGDKNTQFGQLEKSSNIQLGVKYTF